MNAPARGSLDAAETELQRAQLTGDAGRLESLLHPEVVYVAPDGAEFNRSQDVDSHRSGQLRLTRLEQLTRATRQFESTGLTRVRARIAGVAGDDSFEAEMVYSRTWLFQDARWQVIQAQGAIVPPER